MLITKHTEWLDELVFIEPLWLISIPKQVKYNTGYNVTYAVENVAFGVALVGPCWCRHYWRYYITKREISLCFLGIGIHKKT